MALTFYGYPKCGTCRKAEKWFESRSVPIDYVHIVLNPPGRSEIAELHRKCGLPIKKFFNTSGKKYRELGLKDKMNSASESELIDLLASDGMLLKRPIVTDGDKVTVGFKEENFNDKWGS